MIDDIHLIESNGSNAMIIGDITAVHHGPDVTATAEPNGAVTVKANCAAGPWIPIDRIKEDPRAKRDEVLVWDGRVCVYLARLCSDGMLMTDNGPILVASHYARINAPKEER